MGEYIVLEIGDAAYSEFRMKSGGFESTEDAVVVGIVHAGSKADAIRKATEFPYCKERDFDMLVAYELKQI